MAKVYVGTSGWAYASWKHGFYPRNLSAAKFLTHYSSRLNSVEVNYTFQTLPTEALLARWISATPRGFQFAVKANYMITHVQRLRGAGKRTAGFLSLLKPLRQTKKLGPVLFQLPPWLKCDAEVLRKFLMKLPRGYRAAFEFRHASWFCEEVFAALRRDNAALCLAESEKLVAPDVHTADFSYLRLRKERYTPSARKELAQRLARLSRRGDVFVYFKHGEKPHGAHWAEELLAAQRK